MFLGLSLAALLLAPASAAPDATVVECRRLLSRFPFRPSLAALALTDRCAALSDLPAAERAAALFHGAEIRSTTGDASGAERGLERALKLAPGDPDTLILLAQLMRDRPEQALGFAEEAGAHRLAGEIRLDLGDKAGAEASLKRALESAADDIDALGLLALIKRGQPGPAAAYAARARKAADAAPLWLRGSAYRLCARIHDDLKDTAGALADLRLALDVDPDDLDALQAMARIKRRQPKAVLPPAGPPPSEAAPAPALTEAAAVRFTASIPRAPAWQQAAAYHRSARLWLDLGDHDRALEVLHILYDRVELTASSRALYETFSNEQLQWKWHVLTYYSRIAQARAELGDLAGAETSLQRALDLAPDRVMALEEMVRLKLSEGRAEEALVFARRLVEAAEKETQETIFQDLLEGEIVFTDAPRFKVPWKQGAHVLTEDAGEAERARVWIEEDRMLAQRTMAQVLSALGRPRQALEAAERLIEASANAPASERAEAWRRKAKIQDELKDASGAAASLNRAIELESGDTTALRELVLLELANHRPKEALVYAGRLTERMDRATVSQRADVWRLKAQIQRDLKDAAGAEASLKRALDLEPRDRMTLRDLAQVELDQGRPRQALAYSDRLSALLGSAPPAERAAAERQKAQIRRALGTER